MDDLISRQQAINKIKPWLEVKGYGWGELNMLRAVINELENMPSAQPERKTGRWIPCPQNASWLYVYKCSECGGYLQISDVDGKGYKANYCSYCGADMRGDKHEAD